MTEITDRIEEVKKILEKYKLWVINLDKGQAPRFNQDDATQEICQLFPQPLDDAVKGEWLSDYQTEWCNICDGCFDIRGINASEHKCHSWSPFAKKVSDFYFHRGQRIDGECQCPECHPSQPQPLDDKELREKIAHLPVTMPTGLPKQFVGTDLADFILALLQPKIGWIIQFLEDGGYGDKSKALNWMQFQDKYDIPAGEFSLVEELKIALKGGE